LKNHCRPGREDFRQALIKAMPWMLGGGASASTKHGTLDLLEGMASESEERDRENLLRIAREE